MTQLQALYRSAPTNRSAASTAVHDSKDKAVPGSKEKSAPDWNLKFSDVERDLSGILGAGSSLNNVATGVGTSVSEAATPTPGSPSSPSATGANGTASPGAGTTATATPQVGSGAGRGSATTAIDAGDRVIVNGASTLPGAPPAGSNPAGTGTATSQATGSPTPVGSAQVADGAASANGGLVSVVDVSKIGVKNLDPQVRVALEQVRTSLELFYDAAKRVALP